MLEDHRRMEVVRGCTHSAAGKQVPRLGEAARIALVDADPVGVGRRAAILLVLRVQEEQATIVRWSGAGSSAADQRKR
jgi:hypothetical protein